LFFRLDRSTLPAMPLLFSYGSLQQEDVQLSTIGRRLDGQRDELPRFEKNANVTLSGDPDSRVSGTVFEITDDELARIDRYEAPVSYRRVAVTLASGRQAWVYLHQQDQQSAMDAEHLRLLRIGYLISGGVNALWALFPMIHITIGILMLSGVFPKEKDIWVPGLMFLIFGVGFATVFAAGAVLKLMTARALGRRSSRTFCMIAAGITAVGIPYGTALGVFTLIVLSRPSVAAMFQTPNR
jgi:gamma-glutamylcyclotransferase (GGCT)/AIG2-like uncharacterized protein YtfP